MPAAQKRSAKPSLCLLPLSEEALSLSTEAKATISRASATLTNHSNEVNAVSRHVPRKIHDYQTALRLRRSSYPTSLMALQEFLR